MIELTRINGSTFFLNPDLLWLVEATPDTILTMTNNEHLMVKESPQQVSTLFMAYKQAIQSHANLPTS